MSLLPAIYQETKKIALGTVKKSPLLAEFSAWCQETYGINVLNFDFDERRQRYHLVVIVKNEHDCHKMLDPHNPNARDTYKLQIAENFPNLIIKNNPDYRDSYNSEYQQQIAQTFQQLAAKHNFAPASVPENLGVTFKDFSEEAKYETFQNAAAKIKKLVAKKYPMVWHTEVRYRPVTIFYYTDADIVQYERNGTTQALRAAVYDVLKKYDELNYFTSDSSILHIDSKENVDTHYEGSLFYYFK